MVPSRENASEATNSPCPGKVVSRDPVPAFQRLICPSCCPTASVAPSGAKARQAAPAVEPVGVIEIERCAFDKIVKDDVVGQLAERQNAVVGTEGRRPDSPDPLRNVRTPATAGDVQDRDRAVDPDRRENRAVASVGDRTNRARMPDPRLLGRDCRSFAAIADHAGGGRNGSPKRR